MTFCQVRFFGLRCRADITVTWGGSQGLVRATCVNVKSCYMMALATLLGNFMGGRAMSW